jgi:Leucine carboxyl methyltransferase
MICRVGTSQPSMGSAPAFSPRRQSRSHCRFPAKAGRHSGRLTRDPPTKRALRRRDRSSCGPPVALEPSAQNSHMGPSNEQCYTAPRRHNRRLTPPRSLATCAPHRPGASAISAAGNPPMTGALDVSGRPRGPDAAQDCLSDRAVYEIDHPTTQADKRAVLACAKPLAPTYVSLDFERDDLAAVLIAASYRRDQRSMFLWEGVTQYLPSGRSTAPSRQSAKWGAKATRWCSPTSTTPC